MEHHEHSPLVHQLPEYADAGYPPSYEYRLPVDVDSLALANLHPWLKELAGLQPPDVRSCLAARWAGLQSEALRQLRDYLLEYHTASLVLTGPDAWLLCVGRQGEIHLIAPPQDAEAIERQLGQWQLGDHRLLAELLVNFGGLREDLAPGGGSLIADRAWCGVTDRWMAEIQGYSQWQGALILFSSRGGDHLLFRPAGQVGWWVADEVCMRDAYPDLETCLLDFVRCRRLAWPFDPYGPRTRFPRVVG